MMFCLRDLKPPQNTLPPGRHERKVGAMDSNSTHGRSCRAEWTERSIPEAKKKVAEQLINFSFKFQLKYGQTLDSEAFT